MPSEKNLFIVAPSSSEKFPLVFASLQDYNENLDSYKGVFLFSTSLLYIVDKAGQNREINDIDAVVLESEENSLTSFMYDAEIEQEQIGFKGLFWGNLTTESGESYYIVLDGLNDEGFVAMPVETIDGQSFLVAQGKIDVYDSKDGEKLYTFEFDPQDFETLADDVIRIYDSSGNLVDTIEYLYIL